MPTPRSLLANTHKLWAKEEKIAGVRSGPWSGRCSNGFLDHGKPFTADDLQLMVWRHGYFEECYFYFSYSPVYDENGRVSGVFCPVIETTDKIIGARRLETLRELVALRRAETVEAACQQAIAVLAKNGRDVPFAFLYMLSEDDASASPMAATDGSQQSKKLPIAQIVEWPIADALAEPVVLENLVGGQLVRSAATGLSRTGYPSRQPKGPGCLGRRRQPAQAPRSILPFVS